MCIPLILKFHAAYMNTCQNSQGHIHKDIHCDILCYHEKLLANLTGHQLNSGKLDHNHSKEPKKKKK